MCENSDEFLESLLVQHRTQSLPSFQWVEPSDVTTGALRVKSFWSPVTHMTRYIIACMVRYIKTYHQLCTYGLGIETADGEANKCVKIQKLILEWAG